MSESTTALSTVQTLPIQSINDLKVLGEIMSQSNMFGTSNASQAIVIATMCHQENIPYSKWMQTNHMIQGRVSKRADAIQADFLRGGGKMKIIKRDEDGSIIELSKDGIEFTSVCTWANAIKEPFVYEGGESVILAAMSAGKTTGLKIKNKYQTPRSRMQMLWARAISDGVRAVDPASCQGVYTPEEVEDFETDVTPPEVRKSIDATEAQRRIRAAAETAKTVKPETVVEAEAVVVKEEPKTNEQETATAQESEQEQTHSPKAKRTPKATPAAPEIEPTPFDTPVGATNKDTDYTICPINGKLFGRKWSDMTESILKMALTLTNPEITERHRDEINKAIREKGE